MTISASYSPLSVTTSFQPGRCLLKDDLGLRRADAVVGEALTHRFAEFAVEVGAQDAV